MMLSLCGDDEPCSCFDLYWLLVVGMRAHAYARPGRVASVFMF